jgi:uncharacterized protein
MSTEVEIAGTGATRKRDKPSLRTCIVTRAELPPTDLIRFVPGPDGTITPDLARRLPGRGVWVTCSRERVAEAVARKAFARSLKRPVNADPDLADRVEQLLIRRTGEALAIANKAGQVVTGFAKVDSELSKGAVAVLIHASEAAEDGSHKLDRKYAAVTADYGQTPQIVTELTIAQLDLAMGRENVVHAALSAGGATTRFSIEAERLGRYRLQNSSPARASSAE